MMKQVTKYTATLLVAMGVATAAQADVTINVDDNIKVTAINGQSVNKSLLQDAKQQFIVEPGTQVITAKYDRLYKFRNGDHDYLRSVISQ